MTLRRTTRLSIAAVAVALTATTACSSGITERSAPSSSSAAVESSPAFPSESVPPGVEKDSVLDLNSTKDMTGVVTTVPINQSPYVDHLPDICELIPANIMNELGVDTKKRGFRGTQLISQACVMQHLDETGGLESSVTVNFFTNNIEEIALPSRTTTLNRGIVVSQRVSARTLKINSTGPDDVNFRQVCGTAWGTFFGAIVVNFRTYHPERIDPCEGAIDAAKVIAPLMPRSPSEMRPAP